MECSFWNGNFILSVLAESDRSIPFTVGLHQGLDLIVVACARENPEPLIQRWSDEFADSALGDGLVAVVPERVVEGPTDSIDRIAEGPVEIEYSLCRLSYHVTSTNSVFARPQRNI